MAFNSNSARLAGIKSSRQGIPNKTNREIREAFQKLINDSLPKIQIWLDKVGEDNPEKALMLIAKYAEFVLPKLSKTEMQMEDDEPEIKLDYSLLSTSTLEELDQLYTKALDKVDQR